MYIDISVPLAPGLPVYPGDPAVSLQRYASIAGGSACNLSRLDAGVHSGTHVDAPLHFIEDGAPVDRLPSEAFIGGCFVADATRVEGDIDGTVLGRLGIPAGVQRVLFKTRNSALWRQAGFQEGYCALTEDAATELAQRGVKLAGIDYLSIAPLPDPAPVHIALLSAGALILEGLDLSSVPGGRYELVCLPLLIAGSDGAPARALLRPMAAG